MGEEVAGLEFSRVDFERFEAALRDETEMLGRMFADKAFDTGPEVVGYELEAWLIGADGDPAPRNAEFLAAMHDDMVVEELASFNVEFNAPPVPVSTNALDAMEDHLRETWRTAHASGDAMDIRLAMIGILPTVKRSQLTVANMSDRERYRALNKQVLKMHGNHPMHLDIQGVERLSLEQRDVMLESAATSMQIHLQIGQDDAVRYYNTSLLVSAPMVAAACNSPYLFGRDLWAETRIPLFEQAVDTADPTLLRQDIPARVTFGHDYVRESIFELFDRNRSLFPILLPAHFDSPPGELHHLRFHNGTIWRWNRPLIGIPAQGAPHLRIEHRVVPAGPTVADTVANCALYLGLVRSVVDNDDAVADRLPFIKVRDNFYRAARDGLDASIVWLDGRTGNVRDLLLTNLLPAATDALVRWGLDASSVRHHMNIIERRVRARRTGADWQRAFVARHGRDMRALTEEYWKHQQSGAPVCEWKL